MECDQQHTRRLCAVEGEPVLLSSEGAALLASGEDGLAAEMVFSILSILEIDAFLTVSAMVPELPENRLSEG